MSRASLAVILSVPLIVVSTFARAADPSVDPFAPPPEGSAPSTDDEEAAVLGAPDRPNPPPPPPPPPRRPVATPRRQAQAHDEDGLAAGAAGNKDADKSGLAIELSTSGFASGLLVGGLFIGGRTGSDLILGGFLDYGLTSLTANPPGGTSITNSEQFLRLGFGVRHTFARAADGRVDLYGAGDVSFDYKSAELTGTSSSTTPTETVSAAGFSLALGPGLRLWVHDQIALGYVARLRVAYLSGAAGALVTPRAVDQTDASLTSVGFDGTFQLLGIF